MNKLEIINLNKSFGNKKVTNNLNVKLENGVYGLLGPNGAGKTTLMKQITALLSSDSGKILYNGENVRDLDDKYRDLLGYLPQHFEGYGNFTAKQFLSYMATLKGISKKDAKLKIDETLYLVGLYEVRNKALKKFSGGMKRRVGIAQALLNNPKILVLDEPTAGLDPQERTRFRNLLSNISKDKIIILSTHIISDIESIAKETIIIKDGTLLMKGTHKDILKNMENKVFLIRTNNENIINDIQSKYKVVNIQRGIDTTELRVIGEKEPVYKNVERIAPRFEDVYMFYFDIEDTKAI